MNLDKYNALRKEIDTLQRRTERSRGALEQLRHTLLQATHCDDTDQVETLLHQRDRDTRKRRQTLEREMQAYQKKWEGKTRA